MEEAQTKIDWQYSPKQNQGLDLLEDYTVEEVLYGGAKGGGKTVKGVRWVYRTSCAIIRDFNLKPSKYPLLIGFMGRKRAKDFKETTLETWKKQIPVSAYEINEQKSEITIRDTVKILFGGFDNRQMVEKFNSMELAFFFVDQAEEIEETEYEMLAATLRLKIDNEPLNYKGLLTANPAQCWLKTAFVDKPNVGKRRYLQALPADNPFLPPDYIPRLERIFARRPERLAAYLRGDWSALAGESIVIKQSWLDEAKKKTFHPPSVRKLIVCDPARFGDDESVIYYQENTKIVEEDIFGQQRLTDVAARCAQMAEKHKDILYDNTGRKIDEVKPTIAVDTDGLGGGVADILVKIGHKVIEIGSAAKSSQPDRFHNVRAEMWWTAADKYGKGDIEEGDHDDPELDRQLTTIQYKFDIGGRILIESKEEIKKRLGRSPDRADTRVMGLYVLQFVTPVERKPKKSRYEDDKVNKHSFMRA